MRKLLVTGSNGLIGSEMVRHFHVSRWGVHGVDNNMRADFFGPQGDTRWNQKCLLEQFPGSLIMRLICVTGLLFSRSSRN